MAAKIKTNTLAGYENTAFNYRFLNTTLTPLDILNSYYQTATPEERKYLRLGQWVWNKYGCEAMSHPELFYSCREYDRTYRLLADEYYRQLDVAERSNVDA